MRASGGWAGWDGRCSRVCARPSASSPLRRRAIWPDRWGSAVGMSGTSACQRLNSTRPQLTPPHLTPAHLTPPHPSSPHPTSPHPTPPDRPVLRIQVHLPRRLPPATGPPVTGKGLTSSFVSRPFSHTPRSHRLRPHFLFCSPPFAHTPPVVLNPSHPILGHPILGHPVCHTPFGPIRPFRPTHHRHLHPSNLPPTSLQSPSNLPPLSQAVARVVGELGGLVRRAVHLRRGV